MDPLLREIKYKAACIYYGDHVPLYVANQYDDTNFENMYGLTIFQTGINWNLILNTFMTEIGYAVEHLLWTLYFLKKYPTNLMMEHVLKKSTPTLRKRIWYTLHMLSNLNQVCIVFILCFIQSY